MIEIRRPTISVLAERDNLVQFQLEPLERGFAHTLGNSLRRALLSSLPGAAVTSVKIEGVAHEFATIPGVKEDVADIILNIKELVLKLYAEEPAKLRINQTGPKEVKGSDIECPADVEVINPDLHIATLNKDGKLEAELTVEGGRGYVSAERNKKATDAIGVIPVDSLFSPVKRVTYAVENTRVGQRTDYDKLLLEVQTNGSLSPREAVSIGAKIVNEHMSLFMEQAAEHVEGTIFVTDPSERDRVLDSPVEDLELSVRSYNCLKREGINTLQQLIDKSESDLLKIRNFGAKSIDEVKEKLASLGLSLK